MRKKEFGAADLLRRVTVPQSSVAVGSVQVTVVPPPFKGMVTATFCVGEHVGGLLSTKKLNK